MSHPTLEDKLQAAGTAVAMARKSESSPYLPLVPPEYSNWREEQRAWRESVALLDLTHHMTDLSIQGPDGIRLLSDLGVNSFKGFAPGKAKQLVCCNAEGYVIGDGILFYLDENRISLLGLPVAHNWVQYHAKTGGYKVTLERDEPTAINPSGRRKLYRFQVQGPEALKLLETATEGSLPRIKFFNIGELEIAGKKVRALRHGMSGASGLELFGPWDERGAVRPALLEAGSSLELRQVGYLAYPTTTLESGWIPGPLPAIFTGEALRAYRAWLPATSFEAARSLAGSFASDDITDYYATPYDLGYGDFVRFDHDFIGRKALETTCKAPRRRKVTLAWNANDVSTVMHTLYEKGNTAQYIPLPWSSRYDSWHYDQVLQEGHLVGLSMCCGYTYNERAMLSLATIDADVAIGSEVTLIWGDAVRRLVTEPHVQVKIRAVVAPCPYAEVARTSYAVGWRTA